MSTGLSRFLFLGLSVAVMLSALMVINSAYQSRALVNDLRHLRAQGDLLAAQHERLELDYAWWSGQTRIDRDARKLLGMVPVTKVRALHYVAEVAR
jgi:cell division protein FtsL